MASNNEDTVEQLRASFQAKEKEWERSRLTLEARISALADQSTAAKRALDLEKKLTLAGSHLKTLAQENARLTKQQQAAAAANHAKVDEQKHLEEQLRDSEQHLKDLEKHMTELKASLEESEQRQKKLEEENLALRKAADEEVEIAQQKAQEDQQIKQQQKELQALRDNEIKAYQDELDQLKAEKQASDEAVHSLQAEIDTLKSESVVPKSNGDTDDHSEDIKESFQVRERELMDLVQALDTLANSNKSVVANEIDLPTTPLLAKIKELEKLVEDGEKTTVDDTVNGSADSVVDDGANERYAEHLKELEETVKVLRDEVKDAARKATDDIASHVVSLLSKLMNAEDDDSFTLDSTLPISLSRAIEDLRESVQQQREKDKESIRVAETSSSTAQSELKRQVTSLQLQINQLNDEREQLQSDKDSLQERLSAATEGSEASEQMKLTLDDLNGRLESVTGERDTARKAIQDLEANLLQVQNSKSHLEKEHNSLLEKLSAMKNALGPRLQANQEENKKLREHNNELNEACEDLRRECESLQGENTQLRNQLGARDQEASKEIGRLEKELSHLKHRVETLQSEREEWELRAMEESTQRVQIAEQLRNAMKDLEHANEEYRAQTEQRESERTSLANLQAVLEEFQTSKELEIRSAVERMEHQLETAKTSLAEYQERATVAENELQQYHRDVEKSQKYEQEIKEKNLLIGKLRHEAIILNEHLVEAMKRIKEGVSDTSVDRQLITNLFVGFLVAPRGDRKRYDILNVIASVLQLSDEQKAQIGLIRPGSGRPSTGHTPSPQGWMSPTGGMEQPEEKESFTDAWISFLLKEANRGTGSRQSLSSASTPRASMDNMENHRPA
ncbi:hypothetical protein NQZ79_g8157 [Umbelopsis isabellina]|nr:hypothetical protein NQZ79_g8157 [Umbelopsis isabellina]